MFWVIRINGQEFTVTAETPQQALVAAQRLSGLPIDQIDVVSQSTASSTATAPALDANRAAAAVAGQPAGGGGQQVVTSQPGPGETDPTFNPADAPFAAFQRGIAGAGLPIGGGILADRLRRQFSPLENLFEASAALGTRGAGPFGEFAGANIGDLAGQGQLALNTVGSFLNQGFNQDLGAGFINPSVNVQGGSLAEGTSPEARQLLSTIQTALGGTLGSPIASGTIGNAFQRNLLRDFENIAGPQGQSFRDFATPRIQNLLGLG